LDPGLPSDVTTSPELELMLHDISDPNAARFETAIKLLMRQLLKEDEHDFVAEDDLEELLDAHEPDWDVRDLRSD
jgi:hypothetical protein